LFRKARNFALIT